MLVELYTSQGCDMCPEAEAILGAVADKGPKFVPVAFHVDYFNAPWKDVYSDARSQPPAGRVQRPLEGPSTRSTACITPRWSWWTARSR